MSLLERIDSPADLRALAEEQLPDVAQDVRERMVDVISRVGGHFAPGLGVVELTVALHYVFDTPRDKLIWDVGHQGYPHKILTGRNAPFENIRQRGGLSGFLTRRESEYDVFGAGHAATSISAGLGIATARDLQGEDFEVVSIIGDGSLTSGIAYEALNNAGHTDTDLIVILNDNEMSISPNVGAISKYLTRVVTNPVYNRMRDEVKSIVQKTGAIGDVMQSVVLKMEETAKTLLTPGMLFEELGFRYVGPVDGHDLPALLATLRNVKEWSGPRLVHVVTKKGKGYALAEENPVVWHGATPFDKISGEMAKKKGGLPAYTNVFGKGLVEMADDHPEMVVITAAMPSGTGTGTFGDAYPQRYFDVGIAEGHGVTFAAGLATEGIVPVVAIYSTFLQRAYDSIIHDVAIQNLPVVFAMDRAGLVGNDGPTHMGLYDIPYMLSVPNMTVTAPKDGAEMLALLRLGVERADGPFCLRYPRDNVPAAVPPLTDIPAVEYGTWEVVRRGEGLAILAVGTMVGEAMQAAAQLEADGIRPTVVNCRFLKPLDEQTLAWVFDRHTAVMTVEEGTVVNGFGAHVARHVETTRRDRPHVVLDVLGVPDTIIEHGTRAEQLAETGLDAASIATSARALARAAAVTPVRETA
ncbi:MAG TPA: 1-deoxy-D-xylulose-5-phosphate synthase [Longimicrobiales bacterium]|nr:1-deoxy-D-xylulose-5-phosphate synthase [Longimicrobiales bacterium]